MTGIISMVPSTPIHCSKLPAEKREKGSYGSTEDPAKNGDPVNTDRIKEKAYEK